MAKLTAERIAELRALIANLDGLQTEIAAAVKRKAGEPVTKFQLKVVNGILERANEFLAADRPIAGFAEFDPDDIPTVGDVGMVVSQYVEALEKVRCEHIQKHFDGTWLWIGAPGIHTVPPRARK